MDNRKPLGFFWVVSCHSLGGRPYLKFRSNLAVQLKILLDSRIVVSLCYVKQTLIECELLTALRSFKYDLALSNQSFTSLKLSGFQIDSVLLETILIGSQFYSLLNLIRLFRLLSSISTVFAVKWKWRMDGRIFLSSQIFVDVLDVVPILG